MWSGFLIYCDGFIVYCYLLLISKQINIFHQIVYKALGKQINPTHYCQILETGRIEKLDTSEQTNLSEDRRHNSIVGKNIININQKILQQNKENHG